jgi:hypothetical protein
VKIISYEVHNFKLKYEAENKLCKYCMMLHYDNSLNLDEQARWKKEEALSFSLLEQ